MARRIAVEGTGEYIKKAAAELRIRRLLAVGICNALGKLIAIRMLTIQARPEHPPAYTPSKYIPATLPHAELPGIRFKMPPLTKPLFPDKVFKDWPELV